MLTNTITFKLPLKLADMPDASRVWVYKANRILNTEEVNCILQDGQTFSDGWRSHGEDLSAAVDILLDRFVVIMVDDQVVDVGGCSIDTSLHFIKMIEQKIDVLLTDRMIVWYEHDGEIQKCRTAPFREKACNGHVNGDTIVYNDLVNNKADLQTNFRVAAKDSWLSNFL